MGELQLGHMSDPLKFLDEVVDLRLGPGIPVIPEVQQSIFVARHPVYHLWGHLANDTDGQSIGHHRRSVRDSYGKARLRAPRLQKVFSLAAHARPLPSR
jgi:hypothetical protein